MQLLLSAPDLVHICHQVPPCINSLCHVEYAFVPVVKLITIIIIIIIREGGILFTGGGTLFTSDIIHRGTVFTPIQLYIFIIYIFIMLYRTAN